MNRRLFGEMVVTRGEEVVNSRCISKEGLTGFPEALVGVREGAETKEGTWKSDAAVY